MEHAKLENWKLAGEFLELAREGCDCDPLLFNELGILAFQKLKYTDAIDNFEKAIKVVLEAGSSLRFWASTLCNLGHTYRRMGYNFTDPRHFLKARGYFRDAMENEAVRESCCAGLGLMDYLDNNIEGAVDWLHKVYF